MTPTFSMLNQDAVDLIIQSTIIQLKPFRVQFLGQYKTWTWTVDWTLNPIRDHIYNWTRILIARGNRTYINYTGS